VRAVSGPARPDVSVVVAAHTLDRWPDIVAGAEALAHQTVAPLEVLLVVDHNDALLARARDELPEVRVLPNTRTPGASGARNTGIAEAKGAVVAFLDDDARPEPDWVERLLAAYDDPAVRAVGGVARPVWPDRRPAHLPPELDWLVGCSYLGQPTARTDVRNLWGCNMSVRADVFAEIGDFDEQIGRVGLIPLGNEETELCIRIGQRLPGARVVYEPSAVVHHRVTEARCEWSYLVSRSHAEGISKAAMSRLVGQGDATSEERRYASRVLPRGVVRELARGNVRGAGGIVTCLAVTAWWYLRGRLGHASAIGTAGSQARVP
jgi:glucosyl-dolichyl phosphate glucuronosyltransferase